MANIASAEMQRPHAEGKDGVRYVEFTTAEALFRHLNLDPAFFNLNERTSEEILREGNQFLDQMAENLVGGEIDEETQKLLNNCYDYLAEADDPGESDIIFVFGSKTPLRIQTAIELFKKGVAPELVISGRGPFYGKTEDVTEAQKYADTAIAAGVPEEAILVEDKSITLVDNIRRSLNLLDKKDEHITSITIVNSPYTQRRGWCMWRKYLPDTAKIYRVNSGTGPDFDREHWYKNERGIRIVMGEFIKLRNAVTFDSV